MSPRWFHFLFLICCWLQDIQPLVCWPVICLWLLNGNITDYKWNHASSRRAFIQLVSNWVCAFTNKKKIFFLIWKSILLVQLIRSKTFFNRVLTLACFNSSSTKSTRFFLKYAILLVLNSVNSVKENKKHTWIIYAHIYSLQIIIKTVFFVYDTCTFLSISYLSLLLQIFFQIFHMQFAGFSRPETLMSCISLNLPSGSKYKYFQINIPFIQLQCMLGVSQ